MVEYMLEPTARGVGSGVGSRFEGFAVFMRTLHILKY